MGHQIKGHVSQNRDMMDSFPGHDKTRPDMIGGHASHRIVFDSTNLGHAKGLGRIWFLRCQRLLSCLDTNKVNNLLNSNVMPLFLN